MRYTGTDCPRAAAHALTEYVPLAVVTLGAEGAYAVDRRTGETAEVPAIAVEALDPTGAGDVFVAGFVTGTLAGWPLADRLAFAGLTAALSVQEFGGSLSAPGWSEIAAWWRTVQSVEDQSPAALRRYAFLAGLVPRNWSDRGPAPGRPDHRLPPAPLTRTRPAGTGPRPDGTGRPAAVAVRSRGGAAASGRAASPWPPSRAGPGRPASQQRLDLLAGLDADLLQPLALGPMMIPFWLGRSMKTLAWMSSSGLSAGRSSRGSISSTTTAMECGSSSRTPSSAASRISSATMTCSGSSVRSPSG